MLTNQKIPDTSFKSVGLKGVMCFMNISGNVRYQFTEEMIEKAVLNLLRRKNYDSFTVKDVCAEAGINRSSFYAHYQDINDLMIKIEGKLTKKLHAIWKPNNGFYDELFFTSFFVFVLENKIFYRAFLKGNSPSFVAPDMMKKQKAIFKELSIKNGFNYSDSEIDYHLHYFGGGIKEVCQKWLLNDCNESPEQMAKVIYNEYANNAKFIF